MRTMKELAAEAMEVQNASNLCEVVLWFSWAICDLRETITELNGGGSNYPSPQSLGRHPICVLWADKINNLIGIQNNLDGAANSLISHSYNVVCGLLDGSLSEI